MSELSFEFIVCVLAVHWLADFCLQTAKQAQNKSKNLGALLRHCGTYTFALLMAFGFKGQDFIAWSILNGCFHAAIDAITCKITSKLYEEERYHDFFVTIGADQLIHTVTLLGTLCIMKGVNYAFIW